MNAVVSGRFGVAVIVEGGNLFSLHTDDPDVAVPRSAGDLRALLGEGRDLEILENTDIKMIKETLLRARSRDEALHLALILLDPGYSTETREEAVGALDELLEDDKVVEGLHAIFCAEPFPDGADVPNAKATATKVGAKRVCELLASLSWLQPCIRAARLAWDAIPLPLFGDPATRGNAQAEAVRSGLFRRLALALNEEKSGPQLVDEVLRHPWAAAGQFGARIAERWVRILDQQGGHASSPGVDLAEPGLVSRKATQLSRFLGRQKDAGWWQAGELLASLRLRTDLLNEPCELSGLWVSGPLDGLEGMHGATVERVGVIGPRLTFRMVWGEEISVGEEILVPLGPGEAALR